MIKPLLIFLLVCSAPSAQTQIKKPLDHTVYDNWRSVGERLISNDGNFIIYAVNPQEGDGELVLRNIKTNYRLNIPRGGSAVITDDSRYAVLRIKPKFQATRQAKIKKNKTDEMPKDTMAIVLLGTDSIQRIGRIKSFKIPEKGAGWIAYHMEKPISDSGRKKSMSDSSKFITEMLSKLADSVIRKSIDSVKGRISKEKVIAAAQKAAREIYKKADMDFQALHPDAEGDDAPVALTSEGTDLILRNFNSGSEEIFRLVSEYYFDKKGTKLLVESTKNSKDSNSNAMVIVLDLLTRRADTILRSFNDAKGFVFDEDGYQVAFLAERDSSTKSLQKFHKLWYYNNSLDSASLQADKNTIGMRIGFSVSENGDPKFSKDGKKLFFGVSAILPAKDTNLIDFELARVDVWHYNDDYLQPQQLKQLAQELKRSHIAVINPGTTEMVQLGSEDAENVSLVDEGNADWVLAQSTKGNRIAFQWEGRTKNTAYIINTNNGRRQLVNSGYGLYSASPKGKYIYWYNPEQKNYFTYTVENASIHNISSKITEPIYDIENDVPDFPSPSGIIGWTEKDAHFLLKDVYDIWQVDPNGKEQPKNITNGFGKKNRTTFSYLRLDPEKRFIGADETILLGSLNKSTKFGGYYSKKINEIADPDVILNGPFIFLPPVKAKRADAFLMQRMNINESELFGGNELGNMIKLTNNAEQQIGYNWLTVELIKWKMFDGRMSEGLLYKPQNFDPKKKYPVLFYFYERDTDGLYSYRSPAPSASTINVPYFVSNEYLVFDPNIYYKTGEPGPSAYNSVVSAAKFLSKLPWVDSTRMAIQGQSWGGYQVAYLITKTNMFRAAGAGAPVSNMTSAYGGIRWGAGINRQFQYEKSQSRIGATLWQRPDLYIKNSPLFAADKISTPLLIMHNDADGAVPWYQGIELFTAMRRLGKKVWLLQYNGEDHNLVERKNRKDLSIRLGQFFDYYLKGAKPAKWISEGLPAIEKGKDWGLKVE